MNKKETLTIIERKNGFWVYDHIRKQNIAMKVKTEREALISAIELYQDSYRRLREQHCALNTQVSAFVDGLAKNVSDYWFINGGEEG